MLVGSSHFGDVYLGTHFQTGQKESVKLEHGSDSTAHREWEVLKCMDGDGAPRMYYTGHQGSYYVMCMELL